MHVSGFIGGAWSLETALKIVEASIKEKEDKKAEWEAKKAAEEKAIEESKQ